MHRRSQMSLYWLSVAALLGPDYELWVALGTGKHFRYLAAHKMAIALGRKKAQVLSLFHALTGCGTVSSFVGQGKNSMVNLECATTTYWCSAKIVMFTKWHTRRLDAYSGEICHGLAHAQTLTSSGENVCEEVKINVKQIHLPRQLWNIMWRVWLTKEATYMAVIASTTLPLPTSWE